MTKLLNHLSKQALDKKEVLGARKAAESTRCAEGRYEMAIPWKDNELPLQCIMQNDHLRPTLLSWKHL